MPLVENFGNISFNNSNIFDDPEIFKLLLLFLNFIFEFNFYIMVKLLCSYPGNGNVENEILFSKILFRNKKDY